MANSVERDIVVEDENAVMFRELRVLAAKYKELAKLYEVQEAEKRELQRQLETVKTGTDGVWFWMPEEPLRNDLPSLRCPVVMRPETLTALLETTDEFKHATESWSRQWHKDCHKFIESEDIAMHALRAGLSECDRLRAQLSTLTGAVHSLWRRCASRTAIAPPSPIAQIEQVHLALERAWDEEEAAKDRASKP